MQPRTESVLETRLAEALMHALFPCDLGDGIEVVHDVEQIEIEMDCDLDDDAWFSAPYEKIEIIVEPIAVFQAFEDVSSERVPSIGLLNMNAVERSPVWDTLPFAPIDPIEVPAVVRAPATETVPYPRCDDVDTVPFVKARRRAARR
jgi:hypothetical protein